MHKQWIGCAPTNFRPGRVNGTRPDVIVVHIIVGSLVSADRTFLDPNINPIRSAHYGVGRDGTVHQYVAEEDTAYHAGVEDRASAPVVRERLPVNPNRYSIGIEHEGFPDDPWPEPQLATSAALIAEIAQRWSIPIDRRHVIMHREIRSSKTCPGFGLDIDAHVARAAAAAGPGPAQTIEDGFPRTVRITRRVNLRVGSPSVTAPIAAVIPGGTSVAVARLVHGNAAIEGNPWWFEAGGSNAYFWAGATDEVVTT